MALMLQGKGVTNVVVLRGGLAGWQRVGYPVEASSATPAATAAPAATATPAAALPTLPPGAGELGRADAPVTIEEWSDFQ